MQHVLFNDIPLAVRVWPEYRARICVITNTVVYCESGILWNVLSDSYRCAFRDPPHRTRSQYPSATLFSTLFSSPLTSRLSRRQPVKNDRGVSLLGQWQIEYILASSEKRVLRFVYRLSCYAKDRNFCRLRIRRIDFYPTRTPTSATALHYRSAVHNHYR